MLKLLPFSLAVIQKKRSGRPARFRKRADAVTVFGWGLTWLALLLAGQVLAQSTVTIGASTGLGSTYFGPVYNFGGTSTTDNSRHAYLYTAAELGLPNGAQITNLEWLLADGGTVSGNNTFNLLLKNTTATSLTSGTSWGTLATGATTEYASANQTVSGTSGTYWGVPVNNFVYTGGNLQILTDWVRAANPGPEITFYPNAATGMALGTASASTLTNASTLSATTYGNSRPTLRITYAFGLDIGITGITLSSSPPIPAGQAQTVTVTIKNFGTCVISNLPISLTVNAFTPILETIVGPLAPGATMNYTLSAKAMLSGGVNQVTASLLLPTSGTTPCSFDTNPANNTFTLRAGACAGAPLAGAYTINKNASTAGTNFASFTEAASALNGCGVSGPVTFNVVAGSSPYNEQFTLADLQGVSAANTVTFNGNGNSVSFSPTAANPALIKLDNADHVKINNLNLTVDPAAAAGWGVQLINGADFASISNCTITVPLVTGAGFNGIVAGTAPNVAGNNTSNSVFENNTVTGGHYGIALNGTAAAKAQNNRISGNTVKDADVIMVYLNNTEGTLVEGNDISRPTRTTTSSFQGIYMQGANQNNVISRNRIHTSGALATAAYGINFRNGTAPAGAENLVKNNLIYDFENTGATYGIVNVGNGGVKYFHNTIYLAKTNLTTSAVVQGVHQNETAANINFQNNIIVIDAAGTGTGLKHALFFNQPASGISSNRNVLYVTPATAAGHLGFYAGTSHTSLANWQTANSAAFDQNSLSADPQFGNPATGNFMPANAALNNLGRPTMPPVTEDFDGGPPRDAAMPDPGAFELLNNSVDLALDTITSPGSVCGLSNAEVVTISVTNLGTSPQSNIPVTYVVNGGNPVAAVIPGPVGPGATISFSFPVTANLAQTGTFTLVATISQPGDAVAANNSQTKVITNSAFTTLPEIPFEPTAAGITNMRIVTNAKSAVYEHTGASNGALSTKGLILEGVTDPAWLIPIHGPWLTNTEHFSGAYFCFPTATVLPGAQLWLTFDLKQLFKVAHVNTNFRVTVNGNQVGPDYKPPFSGSPISWQQVSVDLTPFRNFAYLEIGLESNVMEAYANGTGTANLVDNIRVYQRTLGVQDAALQSQVTIYPNPSPGTFLVNLPQNKNFDLTLTDLTGRVISRQRKVTGPQTLHLQNAARGLYLLQITGENGMATRKLELE